MGARLTKILVFAALALAVTASSGAAASPVHGSIRGVVPHSGQVALQQRLSAKAIRAAGPTTLTFDSSYQTLINRYFTDVAHDSGSTQNVYSVATQYSDGSGAIQYQSTFGGSYVDRDPLPANGCDDLSGTLHDPYCFTDQQLQAEIQNVLTATGWHGGLDHVFFLMTPNGVGSCGNSGVDCSTDAFCAYHNDFVDSNNEEVIYANEPYEGPYPGCTGTDPADPLNNQGFPNDVDSDTTINTISHEQNEAITDPLGNAWFSNDTNQDENGDLCAYGFGTALGGTPGIDAYNQVINGNHYDLQQEWSNNNATPAGCVLYSGDSNATSALSGTTPPLVYHGGPVMHTNTTYAIYWLPTARNTSAPGVTGKRAVNRTLKTSAGAWAAGGAPYSYQWQRCSSRGTSCIDIPGATAATYKLTTADGRHVVRSTVRATNVNGASQPAVSTGAKKVVDVPAPTKAPRIAGGARIGTKLSGSHGSWTYSPTYRYQWLRCNARGASCSTIHSATHSTYRLTKRDAGHRLRVRITATNAAGSKVAVSPASARVSH